MSPPLAQTLQPCGPVVDAGAAERTRETLAEAADKAGWAAGLREVWPALAPVFAASPYLAGLARRSPEGLHQILAADPVAGLDALIAEAIAAGALNDQAVGQVTGAGARCGSCRPQIRRMIRDLVRPCAQIEETCHAA